MSKNTFDDIVIFGGGAVGLALAALFTAVGIPVRLIARGETAVQVGAAGIRITGLRTGVRQVQVLGPAEAIGERSLVLVCTKAYDLAEAISDIAGRVQSWPSMVFLQNGFDILARARTVMQGCSLPFDGQKAVRAVISIGAEKTGSGQVALHGLGKVYLQESQWSLQLQQLLFNAGMPCEITADIERREAIKGVVNSILNPLTALYQVTSGELWSIAGIEDRIKALIAEDVPILLSRGLQISEIELMTMLKRIIDGTSGNVSSMLQDVRAGRATELEFFNGTLISWAGEQGLAVPMNTALYEQARIFDHQRTP